jgi:histone acetyltransferase (RNA polymerase elongator complex component)
VLTLKARVLRHLRRGYSPGRVRSMVEALKSMGFTIGLVLSPGLPAFRVEDCGYDIGEVVALGAGVVDFVRINPALAMEGSDSAGWVEAGRWVPLEVREAVGLCRQYVDAMDAAGIAVARVGLQPGPDLGGRVVGGPHHPNLRGFVQEERFRDRLFDAVRDAPEGCCIHIRVNPKDLAWAKGSENANIRAVRSAMSIQEIRVVGDDSVPRDSLRVDLSTREGATG